MPAEHPEKDLQQKVIDLHAQNHGRNEIARRLHTTTYRVDQVAQEHGLLFNAERTAKAVEVAKANAGTERRNLAARYRALAARALNETDVEPNPDVVWSWLKISATATDKDSVLEQTLQRAPEDDRQSEAVDKLNTFFGLIRENAELKGIDTDASD